MPLLAALTLTPKPHWTASGEKPSPQPLLFSLLRWPPNGCMRQLSSSVLKTAPLSFPMDGLHTSRGLAPSASHADQTEDVHPAPLPTVLLVFFMETALQCLSARHQHPLSLFKHLAQSCSLSLSLPPVPSAAHHCPTRARRPRGLVVAFRLNHHTLCPPNLSLGSARTSGAQESRHSLSALPASLSLPRRTPAGAEHTSTFPTISDPLMLTPLSLCSM